MCDTLLLVLYNMSIIFNGGYNYPMNSILVIAQNTFRETVRDKVLYNLLFFALLMVVASLLIAELSLNLETIIIPRMGLSIMLFFGILISIFIGTGLVYKEIDKRTIYAMLAKPVSRSNFILGKFLGLSITLFVNCLFMVIGLILVSLFVSYMREGYVSISWAFLPAAYLIFLELMVLIAISLLFSSFSSPVLSIMLTLLLYMIGSLSGDLLVFARTTPSLALKYFIQFIYYIVPNFSNFNFISSVAQGQAVPMRSIMVITSYAMVYIAIILLATIAIFQRRNFK